MTNPDRFRSKGLQRVSGTSAEVDAALRRTKKTRPTGLIMESAPPARTRSASPLWTALKPTPAACVPEAQAEVMVQFRPVRPNLELTSAAVRFELFRMIDS